MERKGSQGQGKDRDSSRERSYGKGSQTMYKAKCSNCGEETEVPFKPDPDRPVYCRECYAKRKPKRY